MISVGAVVGGPECQFFDSRVRQFMRFTKEARAATSDEAEVNIVFHMPGSVIKPGYFGPRVGTFSRKEKAIMIQIGVEEEIVQSTSDNAVKQYIYEVVDEAIGIAKSEFDRRSISYDLEKDRQLLDSWHQS